MRPYSEMRARLTRRGLLALAASAAGVRAASWERKPPAEWTEEEVRRILTDSPWAKVMTVPLKLEKPGERGPATWKDIPGAGPTLPDSSPGGMIGSPVGGIGAPKPKLPQQAQILVRWTSALPVRHALARHKYPGDAEQARRWLEPDEKFYVLEVLGVPSLAAYRGPEVIQTELHRTSYLSTKTGRLLRPDSTYVAVQGLFLGITIRFPKDRPLTLSDRWVECGGRSEQFEFRQRFELRRMVYGGRLEL